MQRNKMSAQERKLRSRLAQLVGTRALIHATLNVRHVTCGKKGCRCAEGDRHRAVYLVSSAKGNKRQVFVPSRMEQEVREWVDNYRMVMELLEEISEGAWAELGRRKEKKGS